MLGVRLLSVHLMDILAYGGYPEGVYLMGVDLSARNCYLILPPGPPFRYTTVLGGVVCYGGPEWFRVSHFSFWRYVVVWGGGRAGTCAEGNRDSLRQPAKI